MILSSFSMRLLAVSILESLFKNENNSSVWTIHISFRIFPKNVIYSVSILKLYGLLCRQETNSDDDYDEDSDDNNVEKTISKERRKEGRRSA